MGADQVDGQVPPPVVGQGELCLGVLQGPHIVGHPKASIHALRDHEMAANIPAMARKHRHVRTYTWVAQGEAGS